MYGGWEHLDTRRGQLQEMAAVLCHGKSLLQAVLDDYPEEADGSGMLEQAIGLVGRCESEIDAAEEDR